MLLVFTLFICAFTQTVPSLTDANPTQLFDQEYAGLTLFTKAIGTTAIQLLISLTTKSSLNNPWVGIGFGDTMLSSEFVICQNQDDQTSIIGYQPTSSYNAPIPYPSDTKPSTYDHITFKNKSILACSFKRDLIVKDSKYKELSLNSLPIVWAFNTNNNAKFQVHEAQGSTKVNIATGIATESTSIPKLKLYHGYGMIFVWLGLLPGGILIVRYFKHIRYWKNFKVFTAVTSILCIFTFILFARSEIGNKSSVGYVHRITGYGITLLIILQFTIGIFKGVSLEFGFKRSFLKQLHLFLGVFLMLVSIWQIGGGIELLYPWSNMNNRISLLWLMYFILIDIWAIVFVAMQVHTQLLDFNKDYNEYGKYMDVEDGDVELETYTWKSLDEAIKKGKFLVVANHWVYDISKWMKGHPGGTGVLYRVNGTDISNDFFREAGYDADELVSKTYTQKAKNNNRKVFKFFSPKPTDQTQDQMELLRAEQISSLYTVQSDEPLEYFTVEDASAIRKARQKHVHTPLAIGKLSKLVIGKLIQPQSPGTAFRHIQTGNMIFDREEYRRYALTDFRDVTVTGSNKPAFRLRFCLLYPHDVRQDMPNAFIPGNNIEIQIRNKHGHYISRYYTPICGDLHAFEIIVRVVEGGEMSTYLASQEAGYNQFKIRGPFGFPHFGVPTQFGFVDLPSHVYFISAGSGITPCLQILSNLYLPVNHTLKAVYPYAAELGDEINVNINDVLLILYHMYDGMQVLVH
ncbi:hypothetical protein BC833DRAFT_576427, partial [Globomyces pollinis-pini]